VGNLGFGRFGGLVCHWSLVEELNINMSNAYKITRLDPKVKMLEVNGETKTVVVELVVGVNAEADDGYADYIDGKVSTPLDPDNFIEFDLLTQEWAMAIADAHIEEHDWHASLDRMIEAKRLRALHKPFAWQVQTEAE